MGHYQVGGHHHEAFALAALARSLRYSATDTPMRFCSRLCSSGRYPRKKAASRNTKKTFRGGVFSVSVWGFKHFGKRWTHSKNQRLEQAGEERRSPSFKLYLVTPISSSPRDYKRPPHLSVPNKLSNPRRYPDVAG